MLTTAVQWHEPRNGIGHGALRLPQIGGREGHQTSGIPGSNHDATPPALRNAEFGSILHERVRH
jgi:hypothetical protein